jgi:hypothetical protein
MAVWARNPDEIAKEGVLRLEELHDWTQDSGISRLATTPHLLMGDDWTQDTPRRTICDRHRGCQAAWGELVVVPAVASGTGAPTRCCGVGDPRR